MLPVLLSAQVQRWVRLYDGVGGSDDMGGAAQAPDSSYRTAILYNSGSAGNIKTIGVGPDGSWLWSTTITDTTGRFTGGLSRCLMRREDGSWLLALRGVPNGSTQENGVLYCLSADGDSLWSRWYGSPHSDGFMGMTLTDQGGAALIGYEDGPLNGSKLVRVDANGDTLWTKRFWNAQLQTQKLYSVDTMPDGGFLLGGYRYILGSFNDMLVIRTNSLGQLLWQRTYGSPSYDSPAHVSALADGSIGFAGSEQQFPLTPSRPVYYRTAPNGIQHLVSFDPMWMDAGAYYTRPVEMSNGDVVIGGYREVNNINRGILVRVDHDGHVVWNRHYQTGNHQHLIHGLERTLDGGFLLSGTAYDSLGISVDGWLLKVDSFGCVVPGCQSLTGLLEQEVERSTFLSVRPNPLLRSNASTELMVDVRSAPDRAATGPFKLVFTSSTGAVVHQVTFSGLSTTLRLPEHLSSGLYHMHLMAGSRWIDGSRLVVE
ncbi:MAG: PQQ-like beta-propeller repeat protein [Flavobacteriales bacterium]|nr:PQQ-like beta-propeller repeat protein [Flavobacteriales bacterium]